VNLRVAWFHPHQGYLNNQIFELDRHRDNTNYPWYYLRQYLLERDIDLQTYDVFEQPGQKPDFYFFINLFRHSIPFFFSTNIKRRQCLLLAWETKLSHGRFPLQGFTWLFLKAWPDFFSMVLTYDRQFFKRQQFRPIVYPQPFFESHRKFWEQKKDRFSTMVASHKQSRMPGERYSTRQEIIRFFEKNHPDSFDLYGVGWHQPQNRWERAFPKQVFHTPLYRGAVDSKLETMAQYQFAFCIENYCYPHYITEKIFDALFVGSVPVYLGAPNVTDYIPASCFIDWRQYQSFDHLYQDMVEIAASDRLAQMRESGWNFLNSRGFYPFSVANFCQSIYQTILDLSTMEKP